MVNKNSIKLFGDDKFAPFGTMNKRNGIFLLLMLWLF